MVDSQSSSYCGRLVMSFARIPEQRPAMRRRHEGHDETAILDPLHRLVAGIDAQFFADGLLDGDLPALADLAGNSY